MVNRYEHNVTPESLKAACLKQSSIQVNLQSSGCKDDVLLVMANSKKDMQLISGKAGAMPAMTTSGHDEKYAGCQDETQSPVLDNTNANATSQSKRRRSRRRHVHHIKETSFFNLDSDHNMLSKIASYNQNLNDGNQGKSSVDSFHGSISVDDNHGDGSTNCNNSDRSINCSMLSSENNVKVNDGILISGTDDSIRQLKIGPVERSDREFNVRQLELLQSNMTFPALELESFISKLEHPTGSNIEPLMLQFEGPTGSNIKTVSQAGSISKIQYLMSALPLAPEPDAQIKVASKIMPVQCIEAMSESQLVPSIKQHMEPQQELWPEPQLKPTADKQPELLSELQLELLLESQLPEEHRRSIVCDESQKIILEDWNSCLDVIPKPRREYRKKKELTLQCNNQTPSFSDQTMSMDSQTTSVDDQMPSLENQMPSSGDHMSHTVDPFTSCQVQHICQVQSPHSSQISMSDNPTPNISDQIKPSADQMPSTGGEMPPACNTFLASHQIYCDHKMEQSVDQIPPSGNIFPASNLFSDTLLSLGNQNTPYDNQNTDEVSCRSTSTFTDPTDFCITFKLQDGSQLLHKNFASDLMSVNSVLTTIPRDINPAFVAIARAKVIPFRATIDKSCSTDDDVVTLTGTEHLIDFLRCCFPTVCRDDLADLLGRCSNDVELAANTLLDSGYVYNEPSPSPRLLETDQSAPGLPDDAMKLSVQSSLPSDNLTFNLDSITEAPLKTAGKAFVKKKVQPLFVISADSLKSKGISSDCDAQKHFPKKGHPQRIGSLFKRGELDELVQQSILQKQTGLLDCMSVHGDAQVYSGLPAGTSIYGDDQMLSGVAVNIPLCGKFGTRSSTLADYQMDSTSNLTLTLSRQFADQLCQLFGPTGLVKTTPGKEYPYRFIEKIQLQFKY